MWVGGSNFRQRMRWLNFWGRRWMWIDMVNRRGAWSCLWSIYVRFREVWKRNWSNCSPSPGKSYSLCPHFLWSSFPWSWFTSSIQYIILIHRATSSTLQTTLYTPQVLSLLYRIKYSPSPFPWYEIDIRSETTSIQENLISRREFLEKSLERYSSAGPEYEKIVKEYLRTHVSILRCEEEIEELEGRKRGRR